MPDEAGAPRRETWQAWWPPRAAPPPLITRAQLLQELQSAGLDVTLNVLRYWESKANVLPAPTRGKPPGSTDRLVTTLYPIWYGEVVSAVYRLHLQGVPLQKLRPYVKDIFIQVCTGRAHWLPNDAPPPLPDKLARALQEYMRSVTERGVARVTGAELRLLTEEGRELSVTIYTPLFDPAKSGPKSE